MVTKKKTAAAKAPSASKLQGLQTKLNKNKTLRANFLKDPGAALRAEGVQLGAAKEAEIAKYLSKLSAPQRSNFQAELQRISIGISVSIRIRISIGLTV